MSCMYICFICVRVSCMYVCVLSVHMCNVYTYVSCLYICFMCVRMCHVCMYVCVFVFVFVFVFVHVVVYMCVYMTSCIYINFQYRPCTCLYCLISSSLPDNAKKNRYRNALPVDNSRVCLHDVDITKPGADYIHANFIDGVDGPRGYIAAQVSG